MKLVEFSKRFLDANTCEKLAHHHPSYDGYKKTFSALEMQCQLDHKRYQPIWELVYKLRSVMGIRDGKYKLQDTVELNEGFFSCDDLQKGGCYI
mgnify:CR=1 FL=1